MADRTCELIVITGMSGAGRTEAMHMFEDLGYFCIDNLPPSLLKSLVTSTSIPIDKLGRRRLAVVCDARNKNYLSELTHELVSLKEEGIDYRMIFLDAQDMVLVARYKANRRRHPLNLDGSASILESIARERALLKDLRSQADYLVDTSKLRPLELRRRITELFADDSPEHGMDVFVYSFGFKYGPVSDADIVIDVRFLPNPFYDPNMRYLTGLDTLVRDFVIDCPETQDFMKRWVALLECVMPGYVAEGKQQLVIAVGCTGGQHRSVAIAQATGLFLRKAGYAVRITHRDLPRAKTCAPNEKGQ